MVVCILMHTKLKWNGEKNSHIFFHFRFTFLVLLRANRDARLAWFGYACILMSGRKQKCLETFSFYFFCAPSPFILGMEKVLDAKSWNQKFSFHCFVRNVMLWSCKWLSEWTENVFWDLKKCKIVETLMKTMYKNE